ncbi:MAG: protein kinase [Pirellulales bacterium]
MTFSNRFPDESNDRLDQVLAEYLRSLEAGTPLDRQTLVDRHPDLADDLRSFFANRDALEQIARPLAGQIPQDHVTLGAGDAADATPRIRYFGEYELLEEIARGGMGVVYKARQVKLNRIVAVKMILSGQLAAEADVQRFYTEARAAAHLQHPNIVAIHEVGEHDGQHYFSMDYVAGESLAARISRGPLPAREAAELLHKIARAVSFAHASNIIHRDLKPANILLDGRGEPHVSDFGLAKQTTPAEEAERPALTATGQVLGTPSYMPPEQAAGHSEAMGPPSDVYSLGAILYCMLTGRPPFQAASALDTLWQVLHHDPVSPQSLNQAVPVDLNTMCLKCLDKDPARRYPSAAEVAEELERFLRGEPIRARPLGVIESTWRRVRRHQRIVQSVGVTIVTTVLVATLAYVVWDWRREQQIGRMALKTDGLPLGAQLQPVDNRSPPLAFTIPTEQPQPLVGGEYRLRAAGAGMLSQDYTASIDAGRQATFSIDLAEDRFWAPLRLDPTEHVDLIRLGSRVDLLLFENRFQRSALRRLDGSSLRPVWTVPIDTGTTVPPGLDPAHLALWRDLAQPWRWTEFRPIWLGLDRSIDDDAQPDLLACWPMHDQLPCIVFSGADGTIRWLRSTPGAAGRLAASPCLADVDSDSTPDLIWLGYLHGQGQLWIEAASGKTGQTLWHHDLPLLSPLNPADGKQGVFFQDDGYQFPCELAQVTVAGAPALVAITPSQAVPVRLASGEVIGTPLAFGGPLAARPQSADVLGDGTHELFWQVLTVRDAHSPSSFLDTVWQTLGEPDRSRIALHDESLVTQQRLHRLSNQPWGRFADLDHDGKVDLLVPREIARQQGTASSAQLAIRRYDLVTGQERWTHTVYPREGASCDEILTTLDVNTDGCDEVVVISSGPREVDEWPLSMSLFVDLLDGSSGKRLATWQDTDAYDESQGTGSSRRFESARWWGVDARGFPQLVVATRNDSAPRNRRRLHVLSPLEGRETQRVDDVGSWHLPDLDGDGLIDLLVARESLDGQQIQAYRSKAPVVWRRLGRLQAAQDLDHDGRAEYVDVDAQDGRHVRILRATDGRLLQTIHPAWTSRALRAPLQAFSWPAPMGNLGGDHTADLLLAGEYHLNPLPTSARTATHPFPLQAIDGRTGHLLWREPQWTLPASLLERNPQTVFVLGIEVRGEDYDGDGRLELLVTYRLEWGEATWSGMLGQLWLAMIDPDRGTFRWQRPVGDVHLLASAIGSEELPWFVAPEVLDLDGDGTRDFVLTVPRPQASGSYPSGPFQFDIEAVSGREGRTLWPSRRLATTLSNIRRSAAVITRMPVVVVTELVAGDRPTIVVAETLLDSRRNDLTATSRTCRVTALRGQDGRELWQHEWQSGGTPHEQMASQLNVAAVRSTEKGGRLIVVREYDQTPNSGGDALTWLNPDGTLLRRNIGEKSWTSDPATTRLWPLDVDGDGQEEIALTRSSRLRLERPDGTSCWPETIQRMGEVMAVESPTSGPRLVVSDHAGYAAIDARTGAVLWRCETGVPIAAHPRESRLVGSGATDKLPQLLSVGEDSLVRVALRVDEAGRYVPGIREGELPAPAADGRFLRRLPWDYAGRADNHLWLAALCGSLLIVVPLIPVYLAVRRGRWNLKTWLMAPVLVAYVIVTSNLLMRLGDGVSEPPTLMRLWITAASGLFVLVFPALVIRWIWHREWIHLTALLGGSLAITLLFGGIGYRNAVSTLGPGESFRWTGPPMLNLWMPAAIIASWLGLAAAAIRRVLGPRTPRLSRPAGGTPRWALVRCMAGAVAVLGGTTAMIAEVFLVYRSAALALVPLSLWGLAAMAGLVVGVWLLRGLGRSLPGAWWIYGAVFVGGILGAVIGIASTDASVGAVTNTSYELSLRIWGRSILVTRGELAVLEPAMLVLGIGLGWVHVLAGGMLGALAGSLMRRITTSATDRMTKQDG